MKKLRKVMAGAIAMMTLSTAAAVTGTVAWFTANNIVAASGMSIKAQAEEGIVIAEELTTYSDASWKTDVTAAHNGTPSDNKGYIPTSTSTAEHWYHANSESANSHQAGTGDNALQEVTPISVGSDGIGNATVKGIANRHVYLLNHFYIQSTVPTDGIANQDLQIKNVTATDSSTDEKAIALNKSLRILFELDGTVQIYAPLADSNFTAVNYAGAAKKVNGDDASPVKLAEDITIPAYVANSNASCLDLSVYCYFEGEDTNCKSANIGTFASISISFKLENVANA
jgi:hypothetical protein